MSRSYFGQRWSVVSLGWWLLGFTAVSSVFGAYRYWQHKYYRRLAVQLVIHDYSNFVRSLGS